MFEIYETKSTRSSGLKKNQQTFIEKLLQFHPCCNLIFKRLLQFFCFQILIEIFHTFVSKITLIRLIRPYLEKIS